MSDQDLFKEDKDTPPLVVTPVVETKHEQPKDYSSMLSMIVNAEGAPKYSSVDDALKGAAYAQAHIANLEREMATLRQSGGESKKIEDLIATLQSQKVDDKPTSNEGTVQPVLSQTAIQDLVKSAVMDINSASVREQNIKTVTGKFKELYGDKASETLYSKANDLSMSKEDINSLIAKNPAAAFRLLGVDNKPNQPNVSFNSSVNTEAFQPDGKPVVKSSMGYVTSKQLTSNWLDSKKRTNEKLGHN